MYPVSYIINGANISQRAVDFFCKKAFTESDQSNEYLIYLEDSTASATSTNKTVSIIPQTGKTRSLTKAIASARGKYLVFTTLENLLESRDSTFLADIDVGNLGEVALPFHVSNLYDRIGIRRIDKAPFILISKNFAVANVKDIDNLPALVRRADKKLTLSRLQPHSVDLPDAIIKDMLFIRPYVEILKSSARTFIRRVEEKRRVKRSMQLRDDVKDVVFNSNIPVFIICRDRLDPLLKLISWLEEENLHDIILIDNDSSYPPLLEYLEETGYEVIRLNKNAGHTSPWSEGIVELYAKNMPFIVSDPDVIPDQGSHGAVRKFCELLTKYPERTKVGFGLKIDDLPDHYDLKTQVITWESQFWESTVEKDVYDAEIDTTFALYRQNTPYTLGPALRTGGRFVARHEPWYIDSGEISAELNYYRAHASREIGTWGSSISDASKIYERRQSKALL